MFRPPAPFECHGPELGPTSAGRHELEEPGVCGANLILSRNSVFLCISTLSGFLCLPSRGNSFPCVGIAAVSVGIRGPRPRSCVPPSRRTWARDRDGDGAQVRHGAHPSQACIRQARCLATTRGGAGRTCLRNGGSDTKHRGSHARRVRFPGEAGGLDDGSREARPRFRARVFYEAGGGPPAPRRTQHHT